MMDSLQVQLYDLLVSTLIGALIVAGLFVCPSTKEYCCDMAAGWDLGSDAFLGIVLVGSAYVLGHLVQLLARQVFSVGFLKRARSRMRKKLWSGLPDGERFAVMRGLMEFYQIELISISRIEALLLAPIHARLVKRDMFLALADFNRSLCLLASLCALRGVSLLSGDRGKGLCVLCVSVFVALLTYGGYMFYLRNCTEFTYKSFLFWWQNQVNQQS